MLHSSSYQQPPPPAENIYMPPIPPTQQRSFPAQPRPPMNRPTPDLYCTVCQQNKQKLCFSTSQVSKNASKRKCRECVKKLLEERKPAAKPVATTLPNGEPNEKLCTVCQKTLPADKFSKRQLKANNKARRCRDCQPVNPPQQNSNLTETKCSICEKMLSRSLFSKKQLSQPVVTRKCTECIGKQLGVSSEKEFHCTACDKKLPRKNFSMSALSGPEATRKCKPCCPKIVPIKLTKLICSLCQEEKTRDDFSKSQLARSVAKRKCKACAEKAILKNLEKQRKNKTPQNPAQPKNTTAGKAATTAGQADGTAPSPAGRPISPGMSCSNCSQTLVKSKFSKSQLSRPCAKRKCKECVQKLTANGSAGFKRQMNFAGPEGGATKKMKFSGNPQHMGHMGANTFHYAPIPPGHNRGKQDIVKSVY